MKCTICNAELRYNGEVDICSECHFKINHVYSPELEVEVSVIPKTGDFGGRVPRHKGQP